MKKHLLYVVLINTTEGIAFFIYKEAYDYIIKNGGEYIVAETDLDEWKGVYGELPKEKP